MAIKDENESRLWRFGAPLRHPFGLPQPDVGGPLIASEFGIVDRDKSGDTGGAIDLSTSFVENESPFAGAYGKVGVVQPRVYTTVVGIALSDMGSGLSSVVRGCWANNALTVSAIQSAHRIHREHDP